MQTIKPNIFIDRDDTFFGVCEAIGEDLGFHANWLRLALAVTTFFNPLAAIGAYAAAGVVVAASRWAYPSPALPAAEASADAPAETAEAVMETAAEEKTELAEAA